jgi:hypothetical protein
VHSFEQFAASVVYRVISWAHDAVTPSQSNRGTENQMSKHTTHAPVPAPTSLNAAADAQAQARAVSDAEQIARINSGPAPRDPFDSSDTDTNGFEQATNAMAQFLNWQGNVLVRLGLTALTGDVAADNPTLVAALATIAAAGAPAPVIERETVAYPGGSIAPGGAFTVDVYVYTHPQEPNNRVRSTEFLLAANPAITIAELVKARIVPDPNA